MIRATNSIALRFDAIGKTLETLILSQLEANLERQTAVLKKLSEQFGNHADVINKNDLIELFHWNPFYRIAVISKIGI